MRKFEAIKKLLSLLLCAVLVMGMLPIPALAAEGDSCASTPDCTGTYDADGICMVCGAAAPAAGDGAGDSDNEETCQHSGGTATCTAQAVCELCGAPYGELADHAYGTDADGKCDVCGGDCAHAEYAEGVCTVCGGLEPHAHTYVDGVCGCGAECAHENYAEGVCTVCGKTEPHTHTYVDGVCGCGEVCAHAEYAEGVCTVCGGLEPHSHSYVNGVCECGTACTHAYENGVCAVCNMEEPVQIDEAVEGVKALIDALPTVEEVSVLSYEEKIALYNGAYMTAGNAYNALTEEQKAEVDAAKLMDLGAYFADPSNLQTLEETGHVHNDIEWTETASFPTNSGSYYLLSSIEYRSGMTVNINGTVNLCLNGKAVTRDKNYSSLIININEGSTLNIYDCSAEKTGKITLKIKNYGTLNIYGGNFEADDLNNELIYNEGTLNISGGSFKTKGEVVENEGNLKITGGTFETTGTNAYCICLDKGEAVISGSATFTSAGYHTIYISNTTASNKLTINGGTFSNTGSSSALLATDGECTINGGTFTSRENTIFTSGGKCIINGGSFIADAGKSVVTIWNDGICDITGGNFNCGNSQAKITRQYYGNYNVYGYLISGGTFHNGIQISGGNLAKYLADGYAYYNNNAVVDVATNANSISGGNVTVAKKPVTTYTVTFDANGGSGTMDAVSGVSGNYTLPECAFTAPSGKQFKAWSVDGEEKAAGDTITVTADTTVTAVWTDITYTISFDANGGTGTMNPIVRTAGSQYTLPANGFTAPEGKMFKAWDVGNGRELGPNTLQTATADITIKAVWAEPVASVTVGTETTNYATVADAINAANKAGTATVTLLADAELSTSATISANIDFMLANHELTVNKQVKVNSGKSLKISGGKLRHTAAQNVLFDNRGTLEFSNVSAENSSNNLNNSAYLVENKSGASVTFQNCTINWQNMIIKDKGGTADIKGGTLTSQNANVVECNSGTVTVTDNAQLESKSSWATIAIYGGQVNIQSGSVKNDAGLAIQMPMYSTEASLNVTGGTISANGKSDTIYVASTNASVIISGGTISNGYGSVSYNSSDGRRYGWSIDVANCKSLTISGSPSIGKVYLQKNNTITIGEDGLTNTTPIGVYCRSNPAPVTGQNTVDYSSKFVSVSTDSSIGIYNENNVVMYGTLEEISGTVTITGTPEAGQTLTAVYTPGAEGETVSYQWYCGETAIANATGTTYTVSESDIGKVIKVVVTGTGKYTGEVKLSWTIKETVAVVGTAPTAKDLTYTGEDQALVTAGTTTDGTMVYSLTEDGEYTESIPTGNAAGSYTVWYKVIGDDNHSDSEPASVSVTIKKAAAAYNAPSANTLTYNGSAQALATAGTTADGTVMYKLGEDGTYSETIPTAANAGTYTVYYYVKGDSNHNNSAAQKIEVTIGQLDITGKTVDITLAGSLTYNGAEQTMGVSSVKLDALTVTYTVSGNTGTNADSYVLTVTGTGSFKGTATKEWSIAQKSVTVTAKDQTITYGETISGTEITAAGLVAGHSATVILTPSTANVTVNGTITASAAVITADGTDVTANYDVSYTSGKLLIEPDTSKIDALTTDNVTSANEEDIKAVQAMMASAETDGVDEATAAQWAAITAKCEALIERIEAVEAENARIADAAADFDLNTVKSSDEAAIAALIADIDEQLATNNLTDEERSVLEGLKTKCNNLIAKIDGTETLIGQLEREVDDLDAETVKSTDKAALEQVIADAETLIDSGNVTEAEKEALKQTQEDAKALIKVIDDTAAENRALTDQAATFDEDTVKSTDKAELEQLAQDIEDLLDTQNLTEDERTALEAVLKQVEGMIDTINETAEDSKTATETIDALDPATVTSDDKDELEQAIETIDALLKDDHLTEDERKALEDAKTDAEALIDVIEAAQDATDTENTEKVEDVTAENVKPEDKEALENAKADLEKALEDNAGNYTEEEKKAIQDEIQRIEDAIEALENVEDVTETITQLPETVEPDDEEAAEKILDAKKAYDELTDHEKSLVDETTKEKLDGLVAALTDYKIIKGNNGKWTKGSSYGLSFTANGPFSKFAGIEVDGEEVASTYYTAKDGSTVITLKQSFLKRLSTGEHTITVLYTDGEASGTFKILAQSTSPATGDDSNLMLWSGLLCVSTLGLVVLLADHKRRRSTK